MPDGFVTDVANQDAALWASIAGTPDSRWRLPRSTSLADHDVLTDHACANIAGQLRGATNSNHAYAAATISSWSRSATRPAQHRVRPSCWATRRYKCPPPISASPWHRYRPIEFAELAVGAAC